MTKKKRYISVFVVFLLTVLMVLNCIVYAVDEVSSIFDRHDSLMQEQMIIDKNLEDARKDLKNQQKLKDALIAKIKSVERNIDSLNKSIDTYNANINTLSQEIDTKEAEIEASYSLLRQRLKVIYMSGEATPLEMLIGAKSFGDFADKYHLIKTISASEEKLIDSLKQSINQIRINREILTKELDEKNKLKIQFDLERNSLTKLQKEYDEIISKLSNDIDTLEQQKIDIEKEKQALADDISRWHNDYTRGAAFSSPDDLLNNISNLGQYVWPAPECNIITAFWGDNRNHQGIDLAASGSAYGLPIVAAADAIVVKANKTDEWGSGWGYYIMLDHGRGYATLYAHCSVIVANVGELVKAGQVIGYVGNTGDSNGAHLHFECWYNGTRYDPAKRLGL